MLGNEAIITKISHLTYTVREPAYAQPVANSEVARNDNLRIEHLRFTLIYCEVNDEGMDGFALFEEINTKNGYFRALDRAELADNSDHYPFAVRDVPCIFYMSKNGDAFKYYHTVYDTWENAIFDNYEPTFKLIVEFIEKY